MHITTVIKWQLQELTSENPSFDGEELVPMGHRLKGTIE